MKDIFIIGASNSSEIAILGRIENSWKAISINEEFRPSLPLSKGDDEDTGSIGIALDCSLALNADPRIVSQNLSDPILFLLNTDGVLSIYTIVSTRRIGKLAKLFKSQPLPVPSPPQETLIAATSIPLSLKPTLGSGDGITTFAEKKEPILTPSTAAVPSQTIPPFSKPSAGPSLGFGFGIGSFHGTSASITSKPLGSPLATDQKEGKEKTPQIDQAPTPKPEVSQPPRLPDFTQPVGGQMSQPGFKSTPLQTQPTSDKTIIPPSGFLSGKPAPIRIDPIRSFRDQWPLVTFTNNHIW